MGTGSAILLNDWTFVFHHDSSQTTALGRSLSIYNGVGNGGSFVGSSITTTVGTFESSNSGSFSSVTWTFAGGLSLTDNETYTAVVAGSPISYQSSNSNPYPNGSYTSGVTEVTSFDTLFRANFSPTPVPFEFDPTGGLLVLGGGWLLRRYLKKKKA